MDKLALIKSTVDKLNECACLLNTVGAMDKMTPKERSAARTLKMVASTYIRVCEDAIAEHNDN